METMFPSGGITQLTTLSAGITREAVTIPVTDASKLPAAPNYAIIGGGEDAELILYGGKSGNNLTDVTREVSGTAAAWEIDVQVGRVFSDKDYDALRLNIVELFNRLITVSEADPDPILSGVIHFKVL